MTIIALALLVLVAGCLVLKFWSWEAEIFGIALLLVGGSATVGCAISLPMNRMEVRAGIARLEAVRASRSMVEGTSNLEVAAWRVKVAEVNADLAEFKFYNKTAFDLWIPDEIEAVRPIQ